MGASVNEHLAALFGIMQKESKTQIRNLIVYPWINQKNKNVSWNLKNLFTSILSKLLLNSNSLSYQNWIFLRL